MYGLEDHGEEPDVILRAVGSHWKVINRAMP